jgi:HAD superfamily hydrolase (TIGR01549 family)
MRVSVVFFDVGGTLVDETELWGGWADRLGVPRLTLFAAMGAALACGGDPSEAVSVVRPELDLAEALRMLREAEREFTVDALYPDVLPCMLALREHGYRIGVGSNEPRRSAKILRRMRAPVDWLPIDELHDVHKPDPAFFARIVDLTGMPAGAIAFVGDRVDNDLAPARAAGMVAVHLRRSPWGVLQADRPEAACAAIRLNSLLELPRRLAELDSVSMRATRPSSSKDSCNN